MPTRDELIEKMKHQLDELNTQIDDIESKARAGGEKLGQKYEEQMTHLKASSRAVKEKIEAVRAAGDDKWEAAMAEAEKVRKALVHSFNYFKSQLK